VADDAVGGSLDPVGVVSAAFDDALTGAVSALAEWMAQDLGVSLGDGRLQVLRGKLPPGR
jgi:hypothetical protein